MFRGIGVGQMIVNFFFSCFITVNIGSSSYYFFASFSSVLPWIACNVQNEVTGDNVTCVNSGSTGNETGRSDRGGRPYVGMWGGWGGRAPPGGKIFEPPQEEKMRFWGGGQKNFEAFYLVKNLKYF